MFRYTSRRMTDDAPLRRRLEELAAERRRFGYRRLHVLLRREGFLVNIKRVRRIYGEAHLQVRKRLRRRVALGRGNPAPTVTSLNERWSLDFVHDTLASRRRIRALTIVDDFSHESLAIEVDTSLSGERGRRSASSPAPHRAGEAHAERLHRELQRQVSR
jgi:putative transposase